LEELALLRMQAAQLMALASGLA
jgi:hypothetical protein